MTLPALLTFNEFLFPNDLAEVIQSAKAAGFGTWTPATESVLGVNSFKGVGYQGRHDLILKALSGRLGMAVFPREMKFRVTGEETGSSYVHSDRSSGDYTAITYLSQEDETSGTGFYRYRPNEQFPNGLPYMPCYKTMTGTYAGDKLKSDMTGTRPDNKDVWLQSDFIQGAMNRCVVFRSDMFHARLPIDGNGTNPDDMRLVHVIHFTT